jgi:hypothetical protein
MSVNAVYPQCQVEVFVEQDEDLSQVTSRCLKPNVLLSGASEAKGSAGGTSEDPQFPACTVVRDPPGAVCRCVASSSADCLDDEAAQ